MSNKEKPVVGQQLYSANVGNAARNRPQELTPVTVTRVGVKYFYTVETGEKETRWNEAAYHIDTWAEKTEYSVDSSLYASREEWYVACERAGLSSDLRKRFSEYNAFSNLSLEQLRRIANIVGIEIAYKGDKNE